MLFIYIHNVSVTLQFKQTSSSRQCLGTTEQLKNMLAKWWPLLYNGKVQMARVGEDLGWWPKHWVYKFNGSHCWKFGCRRLSERYQRLEYQDFDNKEVPSNVPLASSSSFLQLQEPISYVHVYYTSVQKNLQIYFQIRTNHQDVCVYLWSTKYVNWNITISFRHTKIFITITTYSQTSL